MTANQPDATAQAQKLYELGQLAFERGNYRDAVTAFEAGSRLVGRGTVLGGSIQLWLMNAYSAANRQADAIALGELLARHPDRDIRKQSKRVLEILNAPKLNRRADWTTPIPDLSNLEAGGTLNLSKYATPRTATKPRPVEPPPLEDLSQVNTRDNGFVWLSLIAIALTLGGFWLLH